MASPRWIDRSESINLREVAPNLYIGAVDSPGLAEWAAVIDLYGSSRASAASRMYRSVPVLLRWQFLDGDPVPRGLLEAAEAIARARLPEGPVLIHCHAGLSRSASVAYALMRVIWGIDHDEARHRIHLRSDFPVPATLASARAWVQARRLVV
jgi:hypothetical protein